MDGYLALTIVVGMIVAGVTIASVMETLNPQPSKELNKFDAIDKELKRLHSDLSDYSKAPQWYAEEIRRLNSALIDDKEAV